MYITGDCIKINTPWGSLFGIVVFHCMEHKYFKVVFEDSFEYYFSAIEDEEFISQKFSLLRRLSQDHFLIIPKSEDLYYLPILNHNNIKFTRISLYYMNINQFQLIPVPKANFQ